MVKACECLYMYEEHTWSSNVCLCTCFKVQEDQQTSLFACMSSHLHAGLEQTKMHCSSKRVESIHCLGMIQFQGKTLDTIAVMVNTHAISLDLQ
jgi:hypothetical protein